jgi:hypothetical protein
MAESSQHFSVEIPILRQQLDVLVRKNTHVIRPSRREKWSLAVLAVAVKREGVFQRNMTYVIDTVAFLW